MDNSHNSVDGHVAENDEREHKRIVNFTVDGEDEETNEKQLTAAQILGLVGLDPETNYLVEVSPKNRSFRGEPTKEIEMKEGMVFKTKPIGPMPVSCQ